MNKNSDKFHRLRTRGFQKIPIKTVFFRSQSPHLQSLPKSFDSIKLQICNPHWHTRKESPKLG